jgi:hypothetical protein
VNLPVRDDSHGFDILWHIERGDVRVPTYVFVQVRHELPNIRKNPGETALTAADIYRIEAAWKLAKMSSRAGRGQPEKAAWFVGARSRERNFTRQLALTTSQSCVPKVGPVRPASYAMVVSQCPASHLGRTSQSETKPHRSQGRATEYLQGAVLVRAVELAVLGGIVSP